VVWTISGPIDILQFYGQHNGKSVVLKLLDRDIPLLLEKRRLSPGIMVIDGDRVAVFGKLTARRRDVGHAIGYRIAQFFRVRDKKRWSNTSRSSTASALSNRCSAICSLCLMAGAARAAICSPSNVHFPTTVSNDAVLLPWRLPHGILARL
jgi:hypothetical protein